MLGPALLALDAEFPLAPVRGMCLIGLTHVRTEQRHSGFEVPAKSALAGLLSLLLLLAVVVSASPVLHETLHAGSDANSHLCLACSLAQGQISSAELVLVAAVLVLGLVLGRRLPEALPTLAADYRLSPSRAPPAASPRRSVVA